ncbi:MAG TPA: hypothetical protein VK631_16355 [Solirubrobacteraceae bacterium]|nr:hypothetical protein [Solirubrobacteraceae bacterium]
MHLPPIHQQQASGSRFSREPVRAGMGRRYALEGDARPGDVLTLAGGALVRDLNENGLVDGRDASAGVDVLVGFESGRALRGGLVDVRG